MRRALLVSLLVVAFGALAAGPVAAAARPLRVRTSVSPPVQIFGNRVTAQISVIADSTQVDPATLRVLAGFKPFKPVGRPTEVRAGGGRYVETSWTWQLACFTLLCAPAASSGDTNSEFVFPPAQVRVRELHGRAYAVHASFPPFDVASVISQHERALIRQSQHTPWLDQVTPIAAVDYRISPNLLFWLAVALAGVCGAGALIISGLWVLRSRSPLASAGTGLPGSLERALALFFWANARDDETLQRKALERVADELPLGVVELSDAARELAWSRETPEIDEVAALSQRVGVAVNPESGTDG
jgi:hypothetical protein